LCGLRVTLFTKLLQIQLKVIKKTDLDWKSQSSTGVYSEFCIVL